MSDQSTAAPYGSWISPITAAQIYAAGISLGAPSVANGALCWLELRPNEQGRLAVVRRAADGTQTDILPAPYSARTRVHEYGGGATLLDGDTLYFVNFADQRLYRLVPGGEPAALTPDTDTRYADLRLDAARRRLIAVREDHRGEGEAVNSIVAISLDGADAGTVLVDGYDFFSAPRLSPDGSRLAWLSWNHPNMPWDGTELWVAPVAADGSLGAPTLVAGGLQESVFQPAWSPDGVLHFVSDPDGWWNLYRWRDGQVESLYQMTAEFGLPGWAFGMKTYDLHRRTAHPLHLRGAGQRPPGDPRQQRPHAGGDRDAVHVDLRPNDLRRGLRLSRRIVDNAHQPGALQPHHRDVQRPGAPERD